MNKKTTVTIGIPAYNEEANIKNLLLSLLRQNTNNLILEEIIVVSDGSIDRTVKYAKSISKKDKRIKVVDRENRVGDRLIKNEILELANSDILIMLDADVLPVNKVFIEKIVKPIRYNSDISLVGAETIPLPANSFFEKVIANSHMFKKSIYCKINNGDTVYLCHGRARAFSKKLYKNLKFPADCPEDAFSYLFAKKHGYKFAYTTAAKTWFRAASDINERKSQSEAFLLGIKRLENYFPKSFLKEEFSIPKIIVLKSIGKSLLKQPIMTLTYVAWLVYIHLFLSSNMSKADKWQIATTTKKLIWKKNRKNLSLPSDYLYNMFLENSWTRYVDQKEKEIVINKWNIGKFHNNEKENILDLGCGPGRWSKLFMKLKFRKVIGVDINPEMVEFSHKSINNKRFEDEIADIQNLPFKENNFDRVFSFRSFKYANDPIGSIKGINRVLKPGGTILIEFSNYSVQIKTFLLITNLIKKFIPSLKTKKDWYLDNSRFYHKKDIVNLMNIGSLEIKNIYPLFSLPASKLPTAKGVLTEFWILLDKMIFNLLPKSLFARSWILIAEKELN